MANIVRIAGIEAFDKYVNALDSKGSPVLFCFTGATLPTGESWCSDCNDAKPIIEEFLNEVNTSLTFVYVDVGDRVYWKKLDCPFRTDNRLRLMVIPTIIRWKGVQRLEGEQCCKKELLQLLIEEED